MQALGAHIERNQPPSNVMMTPLISLRGLSLGHHVPMPEAVPWKPWRR